jgi:elongation factor Ts
MAQVSMQQVKELRDRTQAGLNDCRSALMESEGDIEKAVGIILKKGLAKSAKRAGALAAEGVVVTRVAEGGRSGVIVEVNIQTDFAARNPDFLAFADAVSEAALGAKDGAELGAEAYPGGSGSVDENRQALVGRLGENITIRRWARVAVPGKGLVHSYVHMGGKIGVLLGVGLESDEALQAPPLTKFVDDTAMQIAAMAPQYLRTADVAEAERSNQKEIFIGQLREQDKAPPEQAWPKIIEGKLAKWAKEICLLDQPSVLQTDKTVDAVRESVAGEIGTGVEVLQFVRFERGEGIEVPKGDDFADEVARMARGN